MQDIATTPATERTPDERATAAYNTYAAALHERMKRASTDPIYCAAFLGSYAQAISAHGVPGIADAILAIRADADDIDAIVEAAISETRSDDAGELVSA